MQQPLHKTTRRDEIVAVAGELFSAGGYHGTSMRDLAGRLELRGSSLYAHFASKDDLLWEIVAGAAAAFVAAADAVASDRSPSARLQSLASAHLAVIRNELPYATVFFQDWIHLSPERRQRLIKMRDDYQQRFRDVIADGVRTGEFRVPDVSLAALVVLSALNFSHQWLDPAGRLGQEELASAFTRQLLGGLRGADDEPWSLDSVAATTAVVAPTGTR